MHEDDDQFEIVLVGPRTAKKQREIKVHLQLLYCFIIRFTRIQEAIYSVMN